MHCSSLRATGGDQLHLETDTSTSSKTMTNLYDTASLYRAAGAIDGANVGCALIADHDMGAIQAAISPDAMSEADLVAFGAVARFSYALVIVRDPSITP